MDKLIIIEYINNKLLLHASEHGLFYKQWQRFKKQFSSLSFHVIYNKINCFFSQFIRWQLHTFGLFYLKNTKKSFRDWYIMIWFWALQMYNTKWTLICNAFYIIYCIVSIWAYLQVVCVELKKIIEVFTQDDW